MMLAERRERMPQSKIFQKPLKNVAEIVDEPKVDVYKMKRMTGEIAKPVKIERIDLFAKLEHLFYEVRYFLGLDGKHEDKGQGMNRNFVIIAVAVIAASVLAFQEYQRSTQNSNSVPGHASSASVSSTETPVVQPLALSVPQPANVQTDNSSGPCNGNFVGAETTTSAPEAPVEYTTPPVTPPSSSAKKVVRKATGRNAERSASEFYRSAEDFWRDHPDLARSARLDKYSESVAHPGFVVYSIRSQSGALPNTALSRSTTAQP